MSHSSDHDMSESSNTGSPQSYTTRDSPYGSPSQLVPQLTTHLTELTCTDHKLYHYINGNTPFLRIIEQPMNHFRFRYVSEMVGTHGCLLGKSYGMNKTKTHPTVELVNYTGRALIRCCLAQHNNKDEHPHKLLEDEQDRDVSYIVPEQGSYKVGFAGMGIIHTAKKDVPGLLFKKFSEKYNNSYNTKELKAQCENIAKGMNLNIVRLKFSAHDIETGKEICEPVFSEPIHNMKSAATNDLKICRISRHSGRPRGGDDVFILVEKVNKKNVMIRFYELDENGEKIWMDNGTFLQSDVHHQYAIVFRTPAYKDPKTPVDVKVFIELVRPSDGRTSESKEFVYKAEQIYKQYKKRKINSSYSSLDSSSSGSIKSINELPVPGLLNHDTIKDEKSEIPAYSIQQLPMQPHSPSNQCNLASALNLSPGSSTGEMQPPGPMWSTQAVAIPHLQLDSTELEEIINRDNEMTLEDKKQLLQADLSQYFSSLTSLSDVYTEENQQSSMNFMRMTLIPDSGRGKNVEARPSTSQSSAGHSSSSNQERRTSIADKKESGEYSALYKSEDGVEVKKLVKELCEIIRNKNGYKTQEVRSKLDRLFDIRLSNGDTFLHMTLFSNLASFEYIVKMIHSVKMTNLLNYTNYRQQTILHLAVLKDLPKIVSLLVAKGCNPMLKDSEEDNAIHYAVKYHTCLEPLLSAIENFKVSCDLNDYNGEKQTALHLATLYRSASGARALLRRGAAHAARDSHGRTPLHLAAYDDNLPVMAALLEYIHPSEIDAVDGHGNTALQIVCGGSMRQNSLEMVKLLLDKKADPMKCEDHIESAWKLSRDKPKIRELIQGYVTSEAIYEDDVKSEPEDDFESADEGESMECGLEALGAYAREVAARVDAAAAWRDLARRLRRDAMLSWYASRPSPTLALLDDLKECGDNVSSKSLALILEEMGQVEAANIIRGYID